MMLNKFKDDPYFLLYVSIGLILLLVFGRLLVFLRFFVVIAVAITGIIWLIYYLLNRQQVVKGNDTLIPQIEQRIDACQVMLSQNQQQIDQIKKKYSGIKPSNF